MIMGDRLIKEAIEDADLVIDEFSDRCLQPASYDLRIGARLLASHSDREIDLSERGSVSIKAGEFALLNTFERLKLAPEIAGHIGIRSYYTRKG